MAWIDQSRNRWNWVPAFGMLVSIAHPGCGIGHLRELNFEVDAGTAGAGGSFVGQLSAGLSELKTNEAITLSIDGQRMVFGAAQIDSQIDGDGDVISTLAAQSGAGSSQLVVSESEGVLKGFIRHRNRAGVESLYELEGMGKVLRAQKMDLSTMGRCAEQPPVAAARDSRSTRLMRSARPGAVAMMGGEPTLLRLLVVYTPEALNAEAGGVSGMNAKIASLVAETNLLFANSNASVRVFLAGKAMISGAAGGNAESGDIYTDLVRLQNTNDGQLDDIRKWRRRANADIVTLLIRGDNIPSGVCGLGFVNTSLWDPSTASFAASYAFNAVKSACSLGVYSFAHEIGHNMGLTHNHEIINETDNMADAAFPFAFGYRVPGTQIASVMAYGSMRVPYFSSPLITYQGQTLGVPAGQSGAADNVAALALTAPVVATFRNYLAP